MIRNGLADGLLADTRDVLNTAGPIAALPVEGVGQASLNDAADAKEEGAVRLGLAVRGCVDTAARPAGVVDALKLRKAAETLKVGLARKNGQLARVAASRVEALRAQSLLGKADGRVVLLAGQRRAAAALLGICLKDLHSKLQRGIARGDGAARVLAKARKIGFARDLGAAAAIGRLGRDGVGYKALGALGLVLAGLLGHLVGAKNVGVGAALVLVTALAPVRASIADEHGKLGASLHRDVGQNGVARKDLVALLRGLLERVSGAAAAAARVVGIGHTFVHRAAAVVGVLGFGYSAKHVARRVAVGGEVFITCGTHDPFAGVGRHGRLRKGSHHKGKGKRSKTGHN